jgi:hypothetical protein
VNLYAIIVVALVAFGSGWTANGWRMDSMEKDRAKQELAQVRLAAATTIRRADNVIQAQNNASLRESRLRSDVAATRSELERVQSAADATATSAGTSHAACIAGASALRDVFKSCTGAVESLAGKADRHVSDIQTLTEGWPK